MVDNILDHPQFKQDSSQVKSNVISDIRIHNYKNTIFNDRNKHRNKNNYNSSNQK